MSRRYHRLRARAAGYADASLLLHHLCRYNFNLGVPAVVVVVLVQSVAICFVAFAREDIWVIVLRAVLVIDGVLLLTVYLLICFWTLSAVNMAHNVVGIAIMPLYVQVKPGPLESAIAPG